MEHAARQLTRRHAPQRSKPPAPHRSRRANLSCHSVCLCDLRWNRITVRRAVYRDCARRAGDLLDRAAALEKRIGVRGFRGDVLTLSRARSREPRRVSCGHVRTGATNVRVQLWTGARVEAVRAFRVDRTRCKGRNRAACVYDGSVFCNTVNSPQSTVNRKNLHVSRFTFHVSAQVCAADYRGYFARVFFYRRVYHHSTFQHCRAIAVRQSVRQDTDRDHPGIAHAREISVPCTVTRVRWIHRNF